jgi:hypothetical protein
MSKPDITAFWDLIDGVLVINLDTRSDRWEAVQAAIDGIVPATKLRRLSATQGSALPGFGHRPWFRGRKRDNTWAGRAGVLLSHRRAIELAQQSGWRAVLILEDDVFFTESAADVLAGLAAELARRPWDACYLGYTDPKTPFYCVAELPPDHRLFTVNGCNTAHAYILRAATFDWLLENLPDEGRIWRWLGQHRAIDRWYYRKLSRRYRVLAVSPSVINQRPGRSDITQRDNLGDHLTEIDRARAVTSGFAWRNKLRNLGWRLAEPRDWLRGQIKKMRGF